MAKNLFVAATEARSGKSAICLGVMELLISYIDKVGFFRPIIDADLNTCEVDNDINLISKHFQLNIPYEQMYAYTLTEAYELMSNGKQEELVEGILSKYNEIEKNHDFVMCEGIEMEGTTASFDFDINSEIINNLGAPILLVHNARNKTIEENVQAIKIYAESFREQGCDVMATIVNCVEENEKAQIVTELRKEVLDAGQMIYTIPFEAALGYPSIDEIIKKLDAKVLYGHDHVHRHVYNVSIAAMQLWNFLNYIKYGTLVITPGDRADILIGSLASLSSKSMPQIAGILLTGDIEPVASVNRLIEGFDTIVPILSVETNTLPTARAVDSIHSVITPENEKKINQALGLFEANVNTIALGEKIISTKTTVITPKMFEYRLLQKAKIHKQKIVLPEGEEERILRAAEVLKRREVADLILLGDTKIITDKIAQLALHLDDIEIINPGNSTYLESFASTYYELRQHKGITMENARDYMLDPSYFGTMMIYKNIADGMVSGATHTTRATIRPSLEFIKTKPGFSIVSSVFLMCLKDRVLVYGDCAINPDPNSQQLAEIALSSAETAQTFGIEPRVALLSYSTGDSGMGADVEKVREATKIAKKIVAGCDDSILIEGPTQYDAAVDPNVAKTKMPNSQVAGRATVLIFPDLNTGNNTYKAVQRSSNALAIGPILQGLNKPVNDLSRGCTIPDIVNTVAITAIQSQAEKGLLEQEGGFNAISCIKNFEKNV